MPTFPFRFGTGRGASSGRKHERRTWHLKEILVSNRAQMRQSVAGTAVGNFMEWYDFGVYSYVAVAISQVFFPAGTSAALVGTFGILAVSFLLRPLGGFMLGAMGDRIGRRRVLGITITVMAIATGATGLLPDYSGHGFWGVGLGFWSVILLLILRMAQGFSTGGEYVGAMTYIAEHAPDRRRGLFGGFLPLGTLSGYVLGAALVTGLDIGLTHEQFLSWGWRVPFLLGAPMGLIAVYMRFKLEESPAFENLSDEQRAETRGGGQQWRRTIVDQWKPLLVCFGLVMMFNVTNYMLTGYLPTYLSDIVGVGSVAGRAMITVVLAILLVAVVFVARLSDHIGRKPIMWVGCGLLIVGSVPAVWLMRVGDSYPAMFAGVLLVGVMLLCFNSTEPSTLPTLFPTNVRYGALATSFNIGVATTGGTIPLIAEALVKGTGNEWMPAFILIVAGLLGIVPMWLLPESANRRLRGSGPSVGTGQEAQYVSDIGTIEDPDNPGPGITEVAPDTSATSSSPGTSDNPG